MNLMRSLTRSELRHTIFRDGFGSRKQFLPWFVSSQTINHFPIALYQTLRTFLF